MVSCWIDSRSAASGPVMRSRMRSAFAELGLVFVRRVGVLRGVLGERFFAENRPFDVGMRHLRAGHVCFTFAYSNIVIGSQGCRAR